MMEFLRKALYAEYGLLLVAATVLTASLTCTPQGFARSAADAAFETAAKSCLDDYLRLNPVDATQLGDHRFDDALVDYSAEALRGNIALMKRHLAALEEIKQSQLTGPNRVDAQILRLSLEAQIFSLSEFKPQEWDPLQYNSNLS